MGILFHFDKRAKIKYDIGSKGEIKSRFNMLK